ncbi:ABC transporter ATP-binding protein [Sporichthya polymorpha]|uniref:ABC transporter ATP-binding protein n=1 Tax=Sporichthya polymorpha TaxID=35751 RepID=UPI0012EB0D54|nr:ABC transporter ATP-binding protein [Sporichthya polymorpha]
MSGVAESSVGAGEVGGLAVQAVGLSKHFGGTRALNDVDIEVPVGRITGIVGPNGSGKTTFLKVLTGFLGPTAGTIRLFGEPLPVLNPVAVAAAGVSQTFQRVALAERMTVAENVLLALDGASYSLPRTLLADVLGFDRGLRGVRLDRVREALYITNLVGYADVLAGALPLGIRRRVELARAIAARPRMLLLDEPASGLDPRESAEMAEEILLLHQRQDLTIVVIEHDMSVIDRLCEQVVVLQFGEVLTAGPTAAVLRDERVREAYLGKAGLVL